MKASLQQAAVCCLFVVWILCCPVGHLMAQGNLVQNPGFEIYIHCPTNQSKIGYAAGWGTALGYAGTPDLYNACAMGTTVGVPLNAIGFQQAHSGDGYSGLILYGGLYYEFMQGMLVTPLEKGKTYCFSMYTNLADRSGVATSGLGVYLDDGSWTVPGNQTVSVLPQISCPTGQYLNDTLNWIKTEALFTANGNESRLTIGNFATSGPPSYIVVDSLKGLFAYYFIDDLSLTLYTPAYAGNDTTLQAGDSLYIGLPLGLADSADWYVDGVEIKTDRSGFWAAPSCPQTYVIKNKSCGIISYDTIHVEVVPDCTPVPEIPVSVPNTFTPNGDGLNDVWTLTGLAGAQLQIYNRWGDLLFSSEANAAAVLEWKGLSNAGEPCHAGTYFYVIRYTGPQQELRNLKGFITLFR